MIRYDFSELSHQDAEVRIYDAVGRLVHTERVAGNEGTLRIATDNWTPGIYTTATVIDGVMAGPERLVIAR